MYLFNRYTTYCRRWVTWLQSENDEKVYREVFNDSSEQENENPNDIMFDSLDDDLEFQRGCRVDILNETFGLDNVSFPVPEPATRVLLACGGLVLRKYRSSRV